MLALELEKRGIDFLIVDDDNPLAASRVSTSVINPVTGRRLARSWKVEEMLEAGVERYQGWPPALLRRQAGPNRQRRVSPKAEGESNPGSLRWSSPPPDGWAGFRGSGGEHGAGEVSYFNPLPIIKLFGNAQEENDWTARASDEDPFVKKVVEVDDGFVEKGRGVVIHGGGWLDTQSLLTDLKQKWMAKGKLVQRRFDYDEIRISNPDQPVQISKPDQPIEWRGQEFSRVVFCEGVAAISNPFFHPLRLVPSKGEYLTVCIKGAPRDRIIGTKYLLVPHASEEFTFGSTYDRDDLSPKPTVAARAELESRLRKLLQVPFEVTGHHFGIRPSTYDRRPLMGTHPKHPQLVIFTGLGSKGGMMASWLAQHLVAHLEDGVELERACWWLR